MKLQAKKIQHHSMIITVVTLLHLTLLLFPNLTYSDSRKESQSNYAVSATLTMQNPAQYKMERKKVLIDDSRGLSVFFMIGIAINVIMASVFAWWFSKEWRKSKK